MYKLKSFAFYNGLMLVILAGVLLFPILAAIFYGEHPIILQHYATSEATVLFSGLLLMFLGRGFKHHLNLSSSMLLCASSWITLSFFGALPFVHILDKSIIDAFFESVSGFTTTGITVFQNLDAMPRSVLLWRSMIQWMGGLGILTFFLFVTFRNEGGVWHLFTAESHKINASRPVPNIFKTVQILWLIYSALTLAETLLLMSLGLSFFDAVTHSFTTLSTGGFSIYDQSVGYYHAQGFQHAILIEYVIILFMFLGGMNFLMHYRWLTGQVQDVLNDTETQKYISLISVSTLLIVISIFLKNTNMAFKFETVFRKTLFQVVSIMTTTGFGTQDIGSPFFTSIAKQLFLILMLIGGCIGSTAGGIKVLRVTLMNRLFQREIKKVYYPRNATVPITVNKVIIKDEELFKIAAISFIWVLLVLAGGMITAFFSDLGPLEAGSGMLSAVSNIGPFYFSVDEMIAMPAVIKLTYIFGMLAGRLEMLPIFLFFFLKTWQK